MLVNTVEDGRTRLQWPPDLIEQEVDGYKIVFNPAAGGPMILSPDEERVFNFFGKGETISSAGQFFQGMEKETFNNALLFLTSKEFLVGKEYTGEPDFDAIPNKDRNFKTHLMITNECNMSCGCCDHCYTKRGNLSMSLETGRKAIDEIVKNAEKNGFEKITIFLFGGEPLLQFPLIKKLMEYTKENYGEWVGKRKLKFKLSTNTLLLNKEMADFLVSFQADVGISAGDMLGRGADPKTTEKFLENLKMIRDVFKNHPDPGSLSVWVVVSQNNLPVLLEITEKILSLNVRIRFSLLKFAPHNKPFSPAELKEYNQQAIEKLSEFFSLMEKRVRANSWVARSSASTTRYSGLNYMFGNVALQWPKRKGCGLGTSLFIVDQLGQVCQCPLALHRPLGRMEEGALELVLQSQCVRDYYKVPGCASCDWKFACAGGDCQLTTWRMLGTYGPSPYCPVYKAILPKWLRLEALFSKRFNL